MTTTEHLRAAERFAAEWAGKGDEKKGLDMKTEIVEVLEQELYASVRGYIAKAWSKIYKVANWEMVIAYWNVGREIMEKQGGAERSRYGDGLIKRLSLKLTAEFGPGYTVTNLKYMRLVYCAFPNRHTLCDQLSWSHYQPMRNL